MRKCMTANELADGILAIEERIFLTKKEHQLFQNSATMLRNQQAEIEALKAGKIRAYDNGVEDGRKPNTHPVKDKPHPKCDEACMYLCQMRELTDEEIIESLAELEHEQWMKWADTIMQTEKISDARFARWASCMIPYADLTEEMKEFDREWARKALAILRKASEK